PHDHATATRLARFAARVPTARVLTPIGHASIMTRSIMSPPTIEKRHEEEIWMSQESRVQEFVTAFEGLRAEVEKIIVGHREIINHVLIGMFAGGHVLLEGVPGLGKTLLVKTLAEGLELSFSRIQFTPDLMPADIIGTT